MKMEELLDKMLVWRMIRAPATTYKNLRGEPASTGMTQPAAGPLSRTVCERTEILTTAKVNIYRDIKKPIEQGL